MGFSQYFSPNNIYFVYMFNNLLSPSPPPSLSLSLSNSQIVPTLPVPHATTLGPLFLSYVVAASAQTRASRTCRRAATRRIRDVNKPSRSQTTEPCVCRLGPPHFGRGVSRLGDTGPILAENSRVHTVIRLEAVLCTIKTRHPMWWLHHYSRLLLFWYCLG